MVVPLYFPIELVVDEPLYGTEWYGPLMVAVFTLLSIYMLCDHILEVNYISNMC